MKTLYRRWRLQFLFAGMLLPVASASAEDSEGVVRLGRDSSTGIVRLNAQSGTVIRAQSPELTDIVSPSEPILPVSNLEMANCEQEVLAEESPAVNGQNTQHVCQDPNCPNHHCQNDVPLRYRMAAWVHNDIAYKSAWFRGKFGHGDRAGHGGYGHGGRGGHAGNGNHSPEYPLAGKYHIVYPADPSYFDARDGQIYAAQGYGGPVSVPLAPVVNHTFNYSWGIPSSRLTPVLHPATQAPIATMPGAYPSAPVSW